MVPTIRSKLPKVFLGHEKVFWGAQKVLRALQKVFLPFLGRMVSAAREVCLALHIMFCPFGTQCSWD